MSAISLPNLTLYARARGYVCGSVVSESTSSSPMGLPSVVVFM